MKTHSSQRFPTSTLVLVTLCIVLGVATSAAGSWTQWGGPARDFSPQASPRLADWGEHGPRVLWLRPLGPGYSGLVTAGPRLITMTRDGADEVLVALDPDTGETLWRDAYAAPTGLLAAVDKSYGDAPQATPLVADGRVIGLGFTGVLTSAAVADGSVVWRHDLLHELQASVPYFGHAASPIRVDDTVVVFAGGAAAFELETGERRWHNRAFEASYASPIVVDGPAGRQLVAAVAGEVVGLDPRDGTLLWRREHANRHRTFLSSPVAGGAASGADGEVVFASAYFLGSLALRLGDGGSIETLWEREDLQVSQSNALRFDSTIVASHNRQLVAVDLLTGTQRWREKGVGRVNLVHAGERTLLLDDRGRLSLARIDADGFERLATTRILDGRTWTAPTLVGDRLYVRDLDRVVAIDLSAAARDVGETFAGRLDGGGDRPPVVAPATFLDAVATVQGAAARGDRQVLVSAATAFDRWQDDGELASFALYYQGFTAWRLSGLVEPDRQLAQVDRAVELLKRAVDIDPALADAHALLSDLYGKYYRLAPQRASVVGPIGDEHLDRALDLDPENPRVVALHGLDLIRSPARYGGDPVRGMRQLGDAITALDGRSRRASDPAPSWGASIFRVWFAQALSRAGDQERAAAVLEAALRIVPENAAARTLLDSLNRAEAGADPEHGSR